jgi:hypothetical protein
MQRIAAACPRVVDVTLDRPVRAHPEDLPGYDDPLFPFGHGLAL